MSDDEEFGEDEEDELGEALLPAVCALSVDDVPDVPDEAVPLGLELEDPLNPPLVLPDVPPADDVPLGLSADVEPVPVPPDVLPVAAVPLGLSADVDPLVPELADLFVSVELDEDEGVEELPAVVASPVVLLVPVSEPLVDPLVLPLTEPLVEPLVLPLNDPDEDDGVEEEDEDDGVEEEAGSLVVLEEPDNPLVPDVPVELPAVPAEPDVPDEFDEPAPDVLESDAAVWPLFPL